MTEEIKQETKEEEKKETPETKPSNNAKPQPKEKKDKIKEQIAKLEEQLKDQHNEYLKVYAEMESIKDRKYASQKVVGELIGPIDMLVKIVSSKAPSPEIENYLIGFKMIANQLVDILKSEGLTEIEALNKEFDPNLMQAVSVEENNNLADNIVVKVMQTGYMYKDRVLRPAMVTVNKNNKKKEGK